MITARLLLDDDLPALLALLAPTEHRSLFLVGNASTHGITDAGGPRQGAYVGAFDGSALVGVAAWFRGPRSITPACEGHADVIVPELLRYVPSMPRVVVGTEQRVEEVCARLPASWPVGIREREVLLVLEWDRYRRPDDRAAVQLPPDRAAEAAALVGMLHREWDLPNDDAMNLQAAERGTLAGAVLVREADGRAVAMSAEAAASGHYVHVGATACEPAHRRRGLARACVAAVIERAREQGRASRGATLFTGENNHGAIALYEAMGFARDAPWELRFLGEGA